VLDPPASYKDIPNSRHGMLRLTALCALAASAAAFAPMPLGVSPACAKNALSLRPVALRSGAKVTATKVLLRPSGDFVRGPVSRLLDGAGVVGVGSTSLHGIVACAPLPVWRATRGVGSFLKLASDAPCILLPPLSRADVDYREADA